MKQFVLAVAIALYALSGNAQSIPVYIDPEIILGDQILTEFALDNSPLRALSVKSRDDSHLIITTDSTNYNSKMPSIRIGTSNGARVSAVLNNHPEGLPFVHWLLHSGQARLKRIGVQPLSSYELNNGLAILQSLNKLYSTTSCAGAQTRNSKRIKP